MKVSQIISPSIGGLVKGLTKTINANPKLAALGAGFAAAGYAAYEKNKRNTVRLFAASSKEKIFYKKIVDDLMRTGDYKKVKEKYVDGGYLWVLRRYR